MTIENAKVLQERLAEEAAAQVQVQGGKELARCLHSQHRHRQKSVGHPGRRNSKQADTRAGRTNTACFL